jgi:DNA replication and repair protein RecF
MVLEQLTLRHFRNYRETTVTFAPAGGYITGANGSGKTNLLEAIYFLANQTSFRTTSREDLQGWHATRCMVGAVVHNRAHQQQSELAIHLAQGNRHLWLNGKETRDGRRFSTHFAAVAFHPGTLNVIKGSPAGRRYLIDRGIASLSPTFVQAHQDFQRALKQRNALLRSPTDAATATVWTERFIDAALHLMHARQEHIILLNDILATLVHALRLDVDAVRLEYRPAVLAKYAPQEREALLNTGEASDTRLREHCFAEAHRLQRAEEAMGQTLFGPQRDDVAICYRGRESRSYASQGQQRLVAFLLVAALATAIHRQCGHRPVVLLDDVVSELDAHNRQVIFHFLQTQAFQVFVTDVEERGLPCSPRAFTRLHVRQVHGYAALGRDPVLPQPAYTTHDGKA